MTTRTRQGGPLAEPASLTMGYLDPPSVVVAAALAPPGPP